MYQQILKKMLSRKADFPKWGSLALLGFQHVISVILMRYVRTSPGEMFISTTSVVSIEVTKILSALIFLFCECSFSFSKLGSQLHTHIIKNTVDLCKLSIPALLFTIQNNLLYLAISNMNVCVFQVTYQLKLLITAVCVVFMLNRSLRFPQWIALVILTMGVDVIQIENLKSPIIYGNQDSAVFGIECVLVSCILSGISCVYFEKILKNSSNVSIWMRNIQLGLFGTIFGLITVYFFDYEVVSERGFFRGYTPLVWASIVVQSGGGLLVACVIKYADNILKGFASSIAIIVSCLASSLLFNTKLTGFLMFGTFLMGVSVFLYSYSSNKSESPESPYLLKNADAQEQIKLNLSSKKNHSESV